MTSRKDVENGNEQVHEEMQLQNHTQPIGTSTVGYDQVAKAGSSSSIRGHPWIVYLSTCVAVCGSYEFGACAGYSSPTQSAIVAELGLSTAKYSLFGSILTFNAMIGAITSGPISDFIGRKWAMRVYAIVCVVGWIAIYFAKRSLALDLGRLANGYGMGAFSYVIPIYISEIAQVNLRGGLATLNQLMIGTGVSVAFVLGIALPWRTLALTGVVPCALLVLGLFFIPESPRWLATAGKQEDFKVALQKLRGKQSDITHEAAEIKNYLNELQQLPKANILDLFRMRYIRYMTIGIGLMVCQQLGGINGICFYVSNIFETAGFSSRLGTIIYAILQIFATIFGASLIDKAGRKPLLLVSAAGSACGCLLTAIAFYLKDHDISHKAAGTLAASGILVYIGSYALGMGAVPWIIMSEIFPMNVKGVAGSLATLVNWFCAWAVSYSFNFLMKWSSYGTFILFVAINSLAIIFIIKVVPETKRQTLEQIQAAIK